MILFEHELRQAISDLDQVGLEFLIGELREAAPFEPGDQAGLRKCEIYLRRLHGRLEALISELQCALDECELGESTDDFLPRGHP